MICFNKVRTGFTEWHNECLLHKYIPVPFVLVLVVVDCEEIGEVEEPKIIHKMLYKVVAEERQ